MQPPAIPDISDISAAERDPTLAVRLLVEERRQWFAGALGAGCDAMEMCRVHAEMIDSAVRRLFGSVEAGRGAGGKSAIVALGGYGRREMGLFCDVDLLFLHEGAAADYIRDVTDAVLYPFWNNGVEIGGATRSLKDCREVVDRDIRALTAMMDARLVCGEPSLHTALLDMIGRHFADRKARRKFVESKMVEMDQRIGRFADPIYLLQPNVKEGEGGIRDFHTLMWIARALRFGLEPSEAFARAVQNEAGRDEVALSLNFIWRVRHALHLIEGKRADRLSEGLKGQVAERLGFKGDERESGADTLMSEYYRHAAALHLQCRRAIDAMKREACPRSRATRLLRRRRIGRDLVRSEHGTLEISREAFLTDPDRVLEIFAASKRMRLPLDAQAKEQILRSEITIDDAARESPGSAARLREIFSSLPRLDTALAEMQECGLLVRFFPEMEPMIHRVQHDGYHFYTTGVHSIRAVGELARLMGKEGKKLFPVAARAMGRVVRPPVLALATLLHDVDKGRGSDHAAAGAETAAQIARRMGYSPLDAGDVAFLVRSHLLMTILAFRRDVRDPALIERFAQSIRSPEMLAMLFLLTFADLRAIGPHVWSDWKGGLLSELYHRTLAHIEEGMKTPERRRREAARLVDSVRRRVGQGSTTGEIGDFLSAMPERYLFANDAETIAAHFMMALRLGGKPVATVFRTLPQRGCTEFSIVTRDAPGLFARIAGVLTANGANIIDAQLYTISGGMAVDILWLTDAVGKPLGDPELMRRIREEMAQVIGGKEDIDRIVGGRFKRRYLSWSQRHRPPEIVIDNDVSALETVVEISADDRLGLLYTIASTFHELGLSIERARITTHVDRVIDVFYIKDARGGKITSLEHLDQIRKRLFEALEE